jgi:4,5-dihydroxyphthalate decarboxylase
LWFAKHGVMPINHMVVVSEELSTKRQDVVREVFWLLQQSAMAAGAKSLLFDTEELRRSLEMIIRYTAQQGLISREFAVNELFR